MSFRVECSQHGPQAVVTLSNADRSIAAEVWPGLGCNCLRWRIGPLNLLYVSPEWESNPVPTRSGIPVLFPFPNRIRDGRYTWAGRENQLPLAPGTPNAIHGFVCRRAWRVTGQRADDTSAALTATIQGSIDAPETLAFWPADYRVTLTTELRADRLTSTAVVENPDAKPLPWGLGYHPYFAVPFEGDPSGADCTVECPAPEMWELRDSLPTGRRVSVDGAHDLRAARPFAELTLDDLYTGFPASTDLYGQGAVEQAGIGRLEVWVSRDFRELVAFTPPHRRAVCLEPYTCANDAVNLQARGINAGWQVLLPGDSRTLQVEYRFVAR